MNKAFRRLPTPMPLPPKSRSLTGAAFPGALLALLVLGVYARALQNGFTILDDPAYVTENPVVKQGLTWWGTAWAFHSNVGSNWHPLTMLSHMLDCEIFGLRPWGHHLTSVCLHAVNTVLLFTVLRRTTGAAGRSFFVALLFGLHPLHVESVAWVAERKDVLSTFFALLTLLAYTGYAKGGKPRDYGLALLWFACGLMSKPMLVTLPCVMLLLDFWPLARWGNKPALRLVLEKIPFFALAAGASAVALATQKAAKIPLAWLPANYRVENGLLAYARYLEKIFWPVDLCAYYPLPDYLPMMGVLLSTALMGTVSVAVVLRMRREPYLFTGWFWFIGMLVPVIGLVQVGMQSMADRYTYLPVVGLFMALVWLAAGTARAWNWPKPVLPAGAAVITVTCAILTWRQIGYWHDSETLLHHAIALTQNNGPAHLLLADELRNQKRFVQAIPEFREGIRRDPAAAWLHRELALDLESAGRNEEAIPEYVAAMRLEPGSAEAGNNLGMALNRLGRYDAAIQVFQVALESHPEVEALHLNLGNALARVGKPADAATQFQKALALNPGDVDAHNNLGAMLFQMRQLDAAAAEFQAVLKLDPENADARRNLDTILQMKKPAP